MRVCVYVGGGGVVCFLATLRTSGGAAVLSAGGGGGQGEGHGGRGGGGAGGVGGAAPLQLLGLQLGVDAQPLQRLRGQVPLQHRRLLVAVVQAEGDVPGGARRNKKEAGVRGHTE